MSDETTRNESERQPCNVRLLGFSAGTEIGLGDLVERVASTFGIAFQVVMTLLALEAGAVADIVDVSPTVTSFSVTTQHSVSGQINSLAVSADTGKPPGAPVARVYAGTFAGV